MAVLDNRRLPPTLALLLACFLAGCGGESEPSIPSAIALGQTAVAFTAVGQTEQLSAAITDQRGDPVDQGSVNWRSSDAAVATVSSTGLVTSAGQGSTQVTATVGAIAATATVSVTQTVAAFQVETGDGQSAAAGQAVPQPLAVRVTDALGSPIMGLPVVFTVTQGGGSVQPSSATTGADGRATTVFTVGPVIGSTQQVTASLTGTSLAVSFSATAVSGYDIIIRFLNTPTPAQAQAFRDAEDRWESLITGDVADGQVNSPAGACSEPDLPAISEQVDDLIIYVSLEPIDGPGDILGAAGPCRIRNAGSLTILGLMRFDTDDLADIQQAGVLTDVILHEMGHVVGFGTLWPELNLLSDPAQFGGLDPHFTGAGAIAAFNAAGGTAYVAGQKVPVEDEGGPGTADSHWRETILDNELMTGFIAQSGNPLSAITVRSLADMGYLVNQAGADPFTFIPALRAARTGRRWHLKNDILSGPIHRVDRTGTVVGVVQR